jgi:UPF0042 nucleotide-binding protein
MTLRPAGGHRKSATLRGRDRRGSDQPATRSARRFKHPFIVLTGLSGSGKSQAIRALEDLGYFCVDNLPTTLIETLARLSLRPGGIEKVAIVVDVRERNFVSQFPKIFKRLRKIRRLHAVLIFLEANTPALVRRFSETRRPHPLAPDRSALEGIREERERMKPLRRLAEHVVDTSAMTVHELRHAFRNVEGGRSPGSQLVVTVLSFGFKHGIPVDSDLLFDVRFLPNPHFIPKLRPHTGRDREVRAFLEKSDATHQFLGHTLNLLRFLIPQYVAEGKSYLTVGVGCTGGRHRSVMVAEALKKGLAGLKGVQPRVRHRDIAID